MKHNFSAGPAILPKEVLSQASKACSNYNDIGLSLLELSHRGPEFSEVMERATQNVYDLTGLSDDYAVLFLTGGASSQFFMIPMNILPETGTAAYVDSGRWANSAVKEAARFGGTKVLGTSAEEAYKHIPKVENLSGYDYLHITSNNTVAGSQYQNYPKAECPLICDMSSDVFSRPLDFGQFDLIYAGAQKNMGPAGTTLVIIKKDLLGKVNRDIPTMLDYQTHIKKGSMFNTPPVFPIYVCMLTMDWIKAKGGLSAIEKRNTSKADMLYTEIDRNSLFYAPVAQEDRSQMNVRFNLHDDGQTKDFLDQASKAGCIGLKGHRSMGGLRASIYNAMDITSIEALVSLMKDFESKMA